MSHSCNWFLTDDFADGVAFAFASGVTFVLVFLAPFVVCAFAFFTIASLLVRVVVVFVVFADRHVCLFTYVGIFF